MESTTPSVARVAMHPPAGCQCVPGPGGWGRQDVGETSAAVVDEAEVAPGATEMLRDVGLCRAAVADDLVVAVACDEEREGAALAFGQGGEEGERVARRELLLERRGVRVTQRGQAIELGLAPLALGQAPGLTDGDGAQPGEGVGAIGLRAQEPQPGAGARVLD